MKTGILGRIMGALAVNLPATVGISASPMRPGHRGTGKSRLAAAYVRYRLSGLPNAPRHWHDRNDGAQLRTLQAAQAKRDRKAGKLHNQTLNAWFNPAHTSSASDEIGSYTRWFKPSLNPFYVAK